MLKRFAIIFGVPMIFLIIGVLTLGNYGTNFDEPFHFSRGQAYFHYFLTGQKDYKDLGVYPRLNKERCGEGNISPTCTTSPPFPDDITAFISSEHTYQDAINNENVQQQKRIWRSFYQNDGFTFDDAIALEDGHPPLGGILASMSNYVLYQKFHILGDVESYHFVEIFISFLLLIGVSFFCYLNFGSLTAILSTLILAFFPLFFSESHFNIKDPLETSFFGLTIILFYFGITKMRWYLVLLSAVISGMALGTKFNALFLPIIVVPWFLYHCYYQSRRIKRLKITKKILLMAMCLFMFPLICIFVFVALWPYLWPDPILNIQIIIKYYKTIGTGVSSDQVEYLIKGFNIFPLWWIITTSPIFIIISFVLGSIYCLTSFLRKKQGVFLLILLWAYFPIIRVSLPNTVIYGGVRHIMEFVPAMAIISGFAIASFAQIIKKYTYRKSIVNIIVVVVVFVFAIYPIIKWHPNENLYFNSLIGGLTGAKKMNIPYWGNSYGNAYYQGVEWLNKNAEPNARLGLPISTMANVPRLALRSDISFSNGYWSGPNQEGEYEMEVVYEYPQKEWYSFQYYDVYLNPVYELKVDGVVILKVWKNTPELVRSEFKNEIPYSFKQIIKNDTERMFDLGKEVRVTRITVEHDTKSCNKQKGGYIALSLDGKNWIRESEAIDYPQVPPRAIEWDDNTFNFLFAGKTARYITINTGNSDSCYWKNPQINIKGLVGNSQTLSDH